MQKHPLLSVKEAAQILRLDERSVRERLINGQLKGEKKHVGLREKWFVYSGSIDSALQREGFVGSDSSAMDDAVIESETVEVEKTTVEQPTNDADDWIDSSRERMKLLAEEIVKPLMEKIESQTELIVGQRQLLSQQEQEIADKDRQLRLLPDLQKQAEEERKAAELKTLEAKALRKQIEAMQTTHEQTEAARQAAEEEIQRLKDEKEMESKAINDQLQILTATVQELQKPKPTWFQKWFLPKSE